MKLVVWVNLYKDCSYYNDWKRGIANQIDKDFEIYFNVEHACRDSDAVLCLDIDDIPQPALTHVAKLNARQHDITAFAMRMFGEKTGWFGKMVDVNDYNVWGLGNTVWRSNILKSALPINQELDMPDWDAVTRACKEGARLHFEGLPLIHYRMYGQNKNLIELDGVYVWGK